MTIGSPRHQFAIVANVARGDPQREAVITPSERITYRAFAERIAATAEALSEAGLQPGARVAFMGLPGDAFLVSEIATHQVGGVWLGLNPRYTVPELTYVLADARPSLVVVEEALGADALGRLHGACEALDPPPMVQIIATAPDLAKLCGKLRAPEHTLDPAVALIVYTSGTTGDPKGACLTHDGISEAARLYTQRYAHPGLRSLLNLPVNHVGSLIDLAGSAIAQGGTLITQPSFDPASIPPLMHAERITLLGQVPAMHLAIDAAAAYDPEDLPALRHLVWSGAAMPRSWIEAHYGRGIELSTCYGQTECTGAVTFTDHDATIDTLANSIGRSAEPDLVRIVNDKGQVAEPGAPGEIEIAGPLLMWGYLNRAAASAETLRDGWLRSGDLGLLEADGNLRLVGRLKEMYKSGGYNVYPREVEAVLEAAPGVHAAAVIAMPDERWQEIGWAFCIADAACQEDTVHAFARERLANYKLPKRIILRAELPLLPIGKIDKRALREVADRDYAS